MVGEREKEVRGVKEVIFLKYFLGLGLRLGYCGSLPVRESVIPPRIGIGRPNGCQTNLKLYFIFFSPNVWIFISHQNENFQHCPSLTHGPRMMRMQGVCCFIETLFDI